MRGNFVQPVVIVLLSNHRVCYTTRINFLQRVVIIIMRVVE